MDDTIDIVAAVEFISGACVSAFSLALSLPLLLHSGLGLAGDAGTAVPSVSRLTLAFEADVAHHARPRLGHHPVDASFLGADATFPLRHSHFVFIAGLRRGHCWEEDIFSLFHDYVQNMNPLLAPF